MKAIRSLLLALGFVAFLAAPSLAALPWGTTSPLQVSGATPTCTYTATALACIENMTANVTSITLAGMTAGTVYTLVLMQDGTGSRTLAQASVTGAPALTTAESAANGYAIWTIMATSASAATFVADNSNGGLFDSYTATLTSPGTALTTGVMLSQGSSIVPGMSASNNCQCVAQTLPATWQTGIVLGCLPATNLVTCEAFNPTAGTITPVAISLNVRISR